LEEKTSTGTTITGNSFDRKKAESTNLMINHLNYKH